MPFVCKRADAVNLIKKEHAMKRLMFLVLLTILTTSACSLLPPQRIQVDRANYLEAVSSSWKEQLLNNLVRLRYGDTLTSLDMTSITTGYELDAGLTAGFTKGWQAGLAADFGSKVPLGVSAAYAYRPTISYSPLRGDALANAMIEPLNPVKILKSLQTGWPADYILALSVKSINNRQSPYDRSFFDLARTLHKLQQAGVVRITVEEPEEPKVTVVPDEYTVTMKYEGKAGKGKNSEEGAAKKKKKDSAIGYLVVDKERIKDDEELRAQVKEFKESLWPGCRREAEWPNCPLVARKAHDDNCATSRCHSPHAHQLSFPVDDLDNKIAEAVSNPKCAMSKMESSEREGGVSYIKHHFGRFEKFKVINGDQELPSDPYCEKIVIKTRSIMQILTIYSKLIEVPDANKTYSQEQTKREKQETEDKQLRDNFALIMTLKIETSKERPERAFVAIKYGDFWFYIDDNKFDSKDAFSSLAGILCMSETGAPKEQTPILTLPVQ
jgi:hypothetical protein